MKRELDAYKRLVFWGRVSGIAFFLTFATVGLMEEERNPPLYLAAFILFQIATFTMIGLGIYQWRFKRKHGIHRHG